MVQKSTFGRVALTAATGLLATATAAGPAVATQAAPGDGPYKGKVIAKTGLNVRTGPSTHFPVVDTLPHGAVVHIACKLNGQWVDGNPRWYRLQDGRYVGGFSAARYIRNIGAIPPFCSEVGKYYGQVIARIGLNVRKRPTTNSPVVDTLPYGTVVQLKCKVNGQWVNGNPRWYKLNDGRFVDGFSAARYISNVGPAPEWC